MRRHHRKLLFEQLLRLRINGTILIQVDEIPCFFCLRLAFEICNVAPEDQGSLLLGLVVLPQEPARELLLCDRDEELLEIGL